VRSDLSLKYVAEHTTTNLPTLYKAGALFAGAAGRRLAFALLLCACATALATPTARAPRAWSLAALAVAVCGTLAWSTLGAPPFERLQWQLVDGRGLAPRLQNPLLFTQQPLLLLGYALILVAAALPLAAGGRATLSRWVLAAWLCLIMALALGPPRPLAVVGLGLTTGVLLLPSPRCQWWPQSRRGVFSLATATVLAAVFASVSVLAARWRSEHKVSIGQGESAKLRDAFGREWILAQQGVSAFRSGNYEITAVTIEARRDGREPTLLVTERRQSVDGRGEEIAEPVVVAGRRHGLAQEVAVRLERTLPGDAAELRVDFQPFKSGLSAAYLLLMATGVVLWIGALRRPA
jgi:cytochrome c biogenesis factor